MSKLPLIVALATHSNPLPPDSKMQKRRFSPRSIKATLLMWALPAMMIGMTLSLFLSISLLEEQAETAFDRTLAGVLQAINANISTMNGGLALEEPFRLLEFFQLTATGNVYYHVAREDGLVEIGFPALPRPNKHLQENHIHFFTGYYLDNQPVRTATLIRTLNDQSQQRIIVQVAESLEERHRFLNTLIQRTLLRDLFVVLLTAGILIFGIALALLPLKQVQKHLRQRKTTDLRPINTDDLPKEIIPLVHAINNQTQHVITQNQLQQQFLHDASHQLRTPLSILMTQVNLALREERTEEIKEIVQAMHKILQRTTRVTNQLLKLARVQHSAHFAHPVPKQHLVISSLIRQAVDELEITALNKKIEIIIETTPEIELLSYYGDPLLLQEALLNLLDNALQYSPHGSSIFIYIYKPESQSLCIEIEDEGPGMSEDELTQAGTRFRRGSQGKNFLGAGLGLAIVKSIIEMHNGTLKLEKSVRHGGLKVSILLP